jgi:hypothetical protein
VPPFVLLIPCSLKGEPGEDPEFPGRVLAEYAWQLWLGGPVVPVGLADTGTAAASAITDAAAVAASSFFIDGSPLRLRRRIAVYVTGAGMVQRALRRA